MNWMRLKEQSRERAKLWARVVFPTPGVLDQKMPRAKRQTTASSIARAFP